MPARELHSPQQVVDWLEGWGRKLSKRGELILIGSGGLLWHAHEMGITEPLPEKSMDVDPVTYDEEVALLAYDCIIGSEFEKQNGWHVNLMPDLVLREFPEDWMDRKSQKQYGNLLVTIPSPVDLLIPKRKRNEPRDREHIDWATSTGLVETSEI